MQRKSLKCMLGFFVIILLSNLCISSYQEGLNCYNIHTGNLYTGNNHIGNGHTGNNHTGNNVCCASNQVFINGNCVLRENKSPSFLSSFATNNPNYIYVVIFLAILIIWFVVIKQS